MKNITPKAHAVRGQSFFELLVAISVIGITLIALVGLSTRSVSNTTFSKNKTLATRYSQEAVEWLRVERDTDWIAFYALASAEGVKYCLNDISAGLQSGTCEIPNTVFIREVTLTSTNPNSVDALVVTSWTGDTGMHESNIFTTLTNWNQ